MVVCRLIAEASVKELPLTEETIQAKTNESNWLKCTPNLWFIMVQGEKEREREEEEAELKLSVDTATVPTSSLENW